MGDCLACQLTAGRLPLPGGLIHAWAGWRVEHRVGPSGLGTLIVKPERHVTAVADLSDGEASALGPLLKRASAVASSLVGAEQVYNCLWSNAGGVPVHIHYVVQPVTAAQMERSGCHGPNLQAAMFADGELPDPDQVEVLAARARQLFARRD
jgi:diadenosine tetraphosphate (Ap4A) HIT family hydrolase